MMVFIWSCDFGYDFFLSMDISTVMGGGKGE